MRVLFWVFRWVKILAEVGTLWLVYQNYSLYYVSAVFCTIVFFSLPVRYYRRCLNWEMVVMSNHRAGIIFNFKCSILFYVWIPALILLAQAQQFIDLSPFFMSLLLGYCVFCFVMVFIQWAYFMYLLAHDEKSGRQKHA